MVAKKAGMASIATGAALMLSLSAAPARAAGECNLLVDATKKEMLTPTHIYSTTTAQYTHGKPESSEAIYTGGSDGAIYVMVRGKWRRSPISPADMVKQEDENSKTTKMTCHYVRDEVVNGQATAVYQAHTETEAGKIDTTIWISKGKGLPLRQELDMDVGGGMGKSHKSMHYEYSNVKAPQV